MTDGRDGPVLIDLGEGAEAPSPAEAPAIEEPGGPTGQAMQTAAALAARPRSRLFAWFWRLLLAVVVFLVSLAAWDFVTGLIARNVWLGWAAVILIGLFVFICLAIVIRELAGLARLKRVERLHSDSEAVLAANDLDGARSLVNKMSAFYRGREDTKWGRQHLAEGMAESFDADTILAMAETRLLAPLDARATREIEAASRQVATVTALVPLAFADVLAALTANVRMIRRVAEIYGGRSGSLGAWRLTRAVITHLVATGAVAVGDDLLGSLGGGHLLAKISRRFGEGLVNGALTARVGVAAMEVCRPLPFSAEKKPSVTSVVRRSLTGLFDRET